MFRKIALTLLLTIIIASSATASTTAGYYTSQARPLLSTGNLDDIRQAYDILDEGFNAESGLCTDCAGDRELIFLHAMTRLAMWVVQDDGGSVDSLIELMRLFDIELLTDTVSKPEISYPQNKRDAYKPPRNYEQLAGSVLAALQANGVNELNEILAELDTITDTPEDPFYVVLYTYETNLFKDVELDYGEVMAIKAAIYFAANVLGAQMPYDTYVDYETNQLIEKDYADMINTNDDILDPHPYLGQILPTPNDPNDGATSLAQIKQYLINAVDMYIDAVDYIQAETDDQSDDIIVIDPNFMESYTKLEEQIIAVQESIINDTPVTLPKRTEYIYELTDTSESQTWTLYLLFNGIGELIEGYIEPEPFWSEPGRLKITHYNNEDDQISLELEKNTTPYYAVQGSFYGNIDSVQTTISDAEFEYWGYYNNSINGISGSITESYFGYEYFDLNPVLGDSPRYPAPVSPRDMLPLYDEYDEEIAGTYGHGLGNDPTLGGILPDMTQEDWKAEQDTQPGGIITLQEVEPYQFGGIHTFVDVWFEDQTVFTDITDDTDTEIDSNIDIDKLYLAYYGDLIYGRLVLDDNDSENSYYSYYNLYLSYSPESTDIDNSIKISLYRDSSDYVGGTVYEMYDSSYGYSYWKSYYGISSTYCRHTDEGIDFMIPWYGLPTYVMGKYLTVESYTYGSEGLKTDYNQTHLQIDGFSTISGEVTYDGYTDAPIYIQAYLDADDPEGSLLDQTFITEPGSYSFDNIPLGCTCYVRAFTPLFNVDNPFETGEFDIEAKEEIFVWTDVLDNIDIDLEYPTIIQNGVEYDGEFVGDTTEFEYFAFDAIEGGNYNIQMTNNPVISSMLLYSRDARTILVRTDIDMYGYQIIDWTCPASGRYYIKTMMYTAGSDNSTYEGTYTISMTSDITCPAADIAAELGVEVMDCNVDILDLAALTLRWNDDCSDPLWCDKADIDNDGTVGLSDIAQMASEWLD